MLVLSRKVDEVIVIDGRVHLRILQIRGNRIRIGIEAPDGMSITRSEITRELLSDATSEDVFDRAAIR